jgi:hypothetical protein
MKKTAFCLACVVLPAAVLSWVIIALVDPRTAKWLLREDRPAEWLQVLFLLLTACLCLAVAWRVRSMEGRRSIRWIFLALGVLTILIVLEELSWGQRIFDFKTPEAIAAVNAQKEVNLHNLKIFHRYKHWLLVLFAVAGCGLIILGRRSGDDDGESSFRFFGAPGYLIWIFGLILLCGLALESAYLLKPVLKRADWRPYRLWIGHMTEIAELGVAIAALSYVMVKYHELKSKK